MSLRVLVIYLLTIFPMCLNGDSDNSKLTCEGNTLNLYCTQGKVIQIIRAYYGRYSVAKCNDKHNTDITLKCVATNACEIIKDL